MKPSRRRFIRQLVPPALVSLLKRAARNPSELWTPEQAALKASHEILNTGCPADAMIVRDGIRIGLHPESRWGFEHFCFIAPEMVAEMDSFVANTKDRSRLLDIGALHGLFSLVFAASHPGRCAVAVDASPIAFARLLYNIHKNCAANIKPLECALSDKTGILTMHYEWEHAVAGGDSLNQNLLSARMCTGDELCAELGFVPDTIKIDVEGHEVKVIRGLLETLNRHEPLIFLEVHPKRIRIEHERAEELAEIFSRLGYRAEDSAGVRVQLDKLATFTLDERLVLWPV